jgi:hypothetical protein
MLSCSLFACMATCILYEAQATQTNCDNERNGQEEEEEASIEFIEPKCSSFSFGNSVQP